MTKFNNLIEQIELFIKKFYKNQMVKGAVLFISIFLFTFLFISVLEYFGRFGNTSRTIFFYSFICVNITVFIQYILIPLFKLIKLSKRLSLSEASIMIGSIFPDISDKLENTLQLQGQLKTGYANNIDLINASIEQKSSTLSIVPFTTGINLNENKKYLKFLLPILIIITLIALIKPKILSDSTERIVNYSTEYIDPAPFTFNLESSTSITQGDSYKLNIKLLGTEIPTEVKITSNFGTYNLQKENNILFTHTFNNVPSKIEFTCEANGFKSKTYVIHVLQKPYIDKMELSFIYPKHTGLVNNKVNNIGDVNIPEGTMINWKITALNTNALKALLKDTVYVLKPNQIGNYKFNKQVFSNFDYKLILSSKDIKNGDTINHNISVIKDTYPEISIIDNTDSLNTFKHFIEGTIADDYGFRGLNAHITIYRGENKEKKTESIKIKNSLTKQFFYYELDYSTYNLKPGDKLEYSFSITDNDAINNYKSSSSIRKTFLVPTLDSLDNLLSEQTEKLKEEIDKSKKDADRIKEKVKDIKNDLINKQSPDWKDKQNLENLLNMQQDLQKQIEELKDNYQENQKQEDEFLENSEELQKKQEDLQKLLDELMDDEMRELMEELQKLMEEMNKDKLIDNLEDMEQKTETMEEELDRTLELFKNMELDKKLESIEEQLKDLAEEQEKLKELTEDKKLSNEELAKKQEEINKKFEEIKKDIDEAKEKNSELEKPRDLEFDKEMEQSIDEETSQSKEKLDQGKSKKAQKNQEKAAELMKQMAEDIKAMQDAANGQQQEEDMDALRFLLENIVNLSHQEENLMKTYKKTKSSDPYYLELNRQQLKIKQSTEIVNDSLIALSKRVFELSTFINDELGELNYNLKKTLIYSEERQTKRLMQNQQYAVTAYNNLALMLSEVLEQMQNQAKSSKPGKGSCNKPGGQGQGKSGSDQMSMAEMKAAMKKQISKMKNGGKPGGKGGEKPGKGGKDGKGPAGKSGTGIPGLSSKEMAKMAFEQGQMRKSLQKMRQELNKDGSGNGNILNDVIKDLEKMENDLLDQNIENNFFKRQQEIMTRLLESEKAIQERGFSEKRKSKTGNNDKTGNQINLTEYNKKKNAEIELLKSMPVGLRVYYKNLVNEYFNSVNK